MQQELTVYTLMRGDMVVSGLIPSAELALACARAWKVRVVANTYTLTSSKPVEGWDFTE